MKDRTPDISESTAAERPVHSHREPSTEKPGSSDRGRNDSARTAGDAGSEAVVVEIVPQERDWRHRKRATRHAPIIPASPISVRDARRGGAIVRFARRAATVSEHSPVLSRFGRMAGEVAAQLTDEIVSVGVTSTGCKNRQAVTAIGLATSWARWGHRTLLICAGTPSREFGRTFERTSPSLGDLACAIAGGHRLPIPQPLTSALDRLDAIAGMDGLSLAQLSDNGVLHRLNEAVRERYDRVIWSLPAVNECEWSPRLMKSVLDAMIISVRKGYANLHSVETLAREVAEMNLPPLQVAWHE